MALGQSLDELKLAFNGLSKRSQWILGGLACYTVFRFSTDFILPLLMKPVRVLIRKTGVNPTDPKFDKQKFYLHMFPRKCTKQVPNLSPYAIKVETWLRLKKISYEILETNSFSSSTGQIPYLYHDGKEVADSGIIIDYIEDVLNMDKTEGLSAESTGLSRAYTTMVEEITAWTYLVHRYGYQMPEFSRIFQPALPQPMAYLFLKFFPKEVIKYTRMRGLGRKTKQQIYQIGNMDIKAISDFLSHKKFMFGDQITKLDCAIFGQLCQIVYVDFHYPHMDFIKEHCTNLLPYMDRIKAACWSDWDDIVHPGHFF